MGECELGVICQSNLVGLRTMSKAKKFDGLLEINENAFTITNSSIYPFFCFHSPVNETSRNKTEKKTKKKNCQIHFDRLASVSTGNISFYLITVGKTCLFSSGICYSYKRQSIYHGLS